MNEVSGDMNEKFTKTGKKKKHSVKKYLSTREMVTGVRKATNLPIPQPMAHPGDIRIFQPSKYDILCGRGKPIQDHTGNLRMRDIVAKYTDFYLSSRAYRKQDIVEEVVKLVKNSGGITARFLKRVGRENYWVEVSDAVACDKVSHALRCMVRKGETSGPQEELQFGRRVPPPEDPEGLLVRGSSTERKEESRQINEGSSHDGAARPQAEPGRDLLLGIRSGPSTGIKSLPPISGIGALNHAVGLQAYPSQSTQQSQIMYGHPSTLPGLSSSATFNTSYHPGILQSSQAPLERSLLLTGGMGSAVTAAFAIHNERIVDMIAREQIQRELASIQQRGQQPPLPSSFAAKDYISAVTEELARAPTTLENMTRWKLIQ